MLGELPARKLNGATENGSVNQVVTVDAVEDVPGGNETALQQAVTMHPVGIGLCVGDWIKEWRAYTGGILKVPSVSSTSCILAMERCDV